MKICLLGATGRTGSRLLTKAAQHHVSVSALVRDPEKMSEDDRTAVLITAGSARSMEDLLAAMEGCDAVLSALSTDGGDLLSTAVPLIIEAMQKRNISRIVTIGTAGILQSRSEPHLLRYQSSESKRKLTRAAKEHHKAYELLSRSGLSWTIVCPTYLPEGEAAGVYRTEADYLPKGGTSITTGDTAHFAFRCLIENLHAGKRVGIAY